MRNELVSLDSGPKAYGVVIDAERMVVDEAATARLRGELRTERGWKEPPFISR